MHEVIVALRDQRGNERHRLVGREGICRDVAGPTAEWSLFVRIEVETELASELVQLAVEVVACDQGVAPAKDFAQQEISIPGQEPAILAKRLFDQEIVRDGRFVRRVIPQNAKPPREPAQHSIGHEGSRAAVLFCRHHRNLFDSLSGKLGIHRPHARHRPWYNVVAMKTIVPTKYWHRLEDGRIQCDLCPRLCKLHEGQQGFCFVRARQENQIVLTTYGRSSGFCIDPIEKKPLNHFLPGTPVLSFGTAGCNLACKFCQNWDMSKSREMDTLADEASPERIARAAEELGCRSVAYTYNDPVIFHEYAIDVAQACHERGIKSVAVTAGYVCDESRAEFYRYMDAANVDLKGFTERFYHQLTGARLQPVLETLLYLKHHTTVWLEITTLLIPGENDSEQELDALAQWVVEHLGSDVPIHFTAFHPDWRMVDKSHTPAATLTMARRIAMKNGIRYAYTGNVHDLEGGSTYCHHCGRKLIGRDWYELSEWNLTADGACRFCSAPCAGVALMPSPVVGARGGGQCR